MTMQNSWRQRAKQVSKPHAVRVAYFVLDEFGDKVDGPFADEEEARAVMLSFADGEFHLAQEYWGPSGDELDEAIGSPSAKEGPVTKLLHQLSNVCRTCKSTALRAWTTLTINENSDELCTSTYYPLNYFPRMQACGLWPSPLYYLDDDNAAWLRALTHDNN